MNTVRNGFHTKIVLATAQLKYYINIILMSMCSIMRTSRSHRVENNRYNMCT